MSVDTRINGDRIQASSMWLELDGYRGYYASPEGHILTTNCTRGVAKIMSKSRHCKGYEVVNVKNSKGVRNATLVHRLIASVYCPNPLSKKQVNHIDGNKANNHYTNLEWVTNKENRAHAVVNGLIASGEKCQHKLKDVDVKSIRGMWAEGHSGRTIAVKFGVGRGYVYDLVNYRRRI